jgi:S1-C subfamily serine protease
MRRAALAACFAVLAAAPAGCGDSSAEPAEPPAAPPRVLHVRVPTGAPGAFHDATAFVVGDGRALTVAHVLRTGRPVFAGRRRARVLRADRGLDAALLAVRAGSGGAALPLGAAGGGERATLRVIRSGRPRLLRATVRRRIRARLTDRDGRTRVRPALELGVSVMPGDSGAPVLDAGGRLIGIVFAQAADRETLTYALDARALGPLLGD